MADERKNGEAGDDLLERILARGASASPEPGSQPDRQGARRAARTPADARPVARLRSAATRPTPRKTCTTVASPHCTRSRRRVRWCS